MANVQCTVYAVKAQKRSREFYHGVISDSLSIPHIHEEVPVFTWNMRRYKFRLPTISRIVQNTEEHSRAHTTTFWNIPVYSGMSCVYGNSQLWNIPENPRLLRNILEHYVDLPILSLFIWAGKFVFYKKNFVLT